MTLEALPRPPVPTHDNSTVLYSVESTEYQYDRQVGLGDPIAVNRSPLYLFAQLGLVPPVAGSGRRLEQGRRSGENLELSQPDQLIVTAYMDTPADSAWVAHAAYDLYKQGLFGSEVAGFAVRRSAGIEW